jgi:hypothetical protein
MKQLFFLFTLIFLTACSPEKKSDCININLAESIKLTNSNLKSLNDISSDYHIIPVETSDSCLLSNINIKYVSDSDIWIKDNHVIYRIDRKNGRILFKLDKKGQGPEEYLSISDFVIDYKTRTIFIYDIGKKKLITYNFDGKYLNSFENDFIGSFDLTDEDCFLVSYNPYFDDPFHIGIYDKSWNLLNRFIPKTDAVNQNGNLHHFDVLYKFEGKHYFRKSFGDTIYQVDIQSINPYFIISKGNLKIPVRIATDISKKAERSQYIYGEFGYMISGYYFSSYFYQNKNYQDVWNLETSSLIYRNLRQGPDSKNGIPFVIQGKTVFVWPKFAGKKYLYCYAPADEMREIIPEMKEDDNPVILKIKIAK